MQSLWTRTDEVSHHDCAFAVITDDCSSGFHRVRLARELYDAIKVGITNPEAFDGRFRFRSSHADQL